MKYPKIKSEMTTKQKILWLVSTRKAVTVTQIAKSLRKSKSTISQHVKELRRSRLLKLDRKKRTLCRGLKKSPM